MATAITPSLRASLEKLQHAGAVNGICLSWRRQVLVSLMPFEDYRVEQLIQILHDARDHFQNSPGGREIESFWMGYLDVHVLSVFSGECGVIFLHVRQEEAEFLTSVAQTFLNDAQLLIAAALGPAGPEEGAGDEENWLPEPPHIDPNQTNLVA